MPRKHEFRVDVVARRAFEWAVEKKQIQPVTAKAYLRQIRHLIGIWGTGMRDERYGIRSIFSSEIAPMKEIMEIVRDLRLANGQPANAGTKLQYICALQMLVKYIFAGLKIDQRQKMRLPFSREDAELLRIHSQQLNREMAADTSKGIKFTDGQIREIFLQLFAMSMGVDKKQRLVAKLLLIYVFLMLESGVRPDGLGRWRPIFEHITLITDRHQSIGRQKRCDEAHIHASLAYVLLLDYFYEEAGETKLLQSLPQRRISVPRVASSKYIQGLFSRALKQKIYSEDRQDDIFGLYGFRHLLDNLLDVVGRTWPKIAMPEATKAMFFARKLPAESTARTNYITTGSEIIARQAHQIIYTNTHLAMLHLDCYVLGGAIQKYLKFTLNHLQSVRSKLLAKYPFYEEKDEFYWRFANAENQLALMEAVVQEAAEGVQNLKPAHCPELDALFAEQMVVDVPKVNQKELTAGKDATKTISALPIEPVTGGQQLDYQTVLFEMETSNEQPAQKSRRKKSYTMEMHLPKLTKKGSRSRATVCPDQRTLW